MGLPLTLAVAPYDHVRDLAPQGIDLVTLHLAIEEIFYRFVKHREWEASEMSFAKAAALVSAPQPDIVCIPVFPSRVFRHSAIYVRPGIAAPKDLEGRRVGVPEWGQTAGIYVRGMLADEYGVDLAKIDWHQAGVREPGRVEKIALQLPAGIRITAHPDQTLAGMLAAGDLDAVISARAVPGRRLFEDFQALERAYFEKTRIFPIMHVIALRREAYERDRWIAMNLFRAFDEARQRSLARLADIGASQVPLPWIAEHVRRWRELAGDDWWPYGVDANRPTLEAFCRYTFEQGVTQRRLRPDELFAPETREHAKI